MTKTTTAIDPRQTELDALNAARENYRREYPKLERIVNEARPRVEEIDATHERERNAELRKIHVARHTMLALDQTAGSAELALRRSADPRLAILITTLHEHWDRQRVRSGDHEQTLASLVRVKAAVAALEALQLDIEADVDSEIEKILEAVAIPRAELVGVDLGWQ